MDPNISEDELKLIMSSSVNTKVYEKSRTGVESRFFDTIAKYGGDRLKPLVMFADDGFMKERVFYIKLRGDRNEVKRFILNKCLVKIALKWRNNNK
jgi:ribosomal protein L31E